MTDTARTRRTASSGAERTASVTIERKKLSDLKPHPRNPRKHPKEGTPEWTALRESLKLDYFDPIVWNQRNGMLVSGHLRTKILGKEGFTHADCVVVDYDEKTHLGRMLSANHLVGEDDWQLRKDIFEELFEGAGSETGIFIEALTGATLSTVEEELEMLRQRETDEEGADAMSASNKLKFDQVLTNIDEPQAEVALGDVWKLGRHRLCVTPIITPPFAWKDQLDLMAQEENQDADLRFVVYPDPYWGITERPYRLCMVQPDPFLAGHIIDNYNGQCAEGEEATKIV
jgi:hypothetical protein